jgi:hypothetical protein
VDVNRDRDIPAPGRSNTGVNKESEVGKFTGRDIPQFKIGIPVSGDKHVAPGSDMGADLGRIPCPVIPNPDGQPDDLSGLDPAVPIRIPDPDDRNR